MHSITLFFSFSRHGLTLYCYLVLVCTDIEIVDIIRGLGLMILKGVMEAHSDKIWDRFVVEVMP